MVLRIRILTTLLTRSTRPYWFCFGLTLCPFTHASVVSRPNLATLKRHRSCLDYQASGDLEARSGEPSALSLAQRISRKLDDLESEFLKHHYAIIDEIDEGDAETLGKEQDTLDQFDDQLTGRTERFIATFNSASDLREKLHPAD